MNATTNKKMSHKMAMRLTLFSSAAVLAALIFTSQASYAYNEPQTDEQSNDQPAEQSSKRRGPPPIAFTVCEGKSEGDKSQFETRRGKMLTGTCEDLDGKLVLRPDQRRNKNQRKGERRTPPLEAFTACAGKSEGELSQFENRRGEILTGKCKVANEKLVLRPDRFKKE